jgi:hypothetical protein
VETAAAPAAPAAPASEAPTVLEPVTAAVSTEADTVATDAPTAIKETTSEPSTTVTQKKTLKLRRPNFKRPTVGGLRKPGEATSVAAPTQATSEAAPQLDEVADISSVSDIPEIKPLPSVAPAPVEDESKTVSGAPAWLNAMTLVAGIAALFVIGLCTWSLYTQATGPDAGPNGLASFYSETDHSR